MPEITRDIIYVGADDRDIDLFEGQYKVPDGVSYNSYVIMDEKIAVMDTVDKRRTAQFLDNLEKVLGGRRPDYLVVNHVEPDHAASVGALVEKYPDITLVGNQNTFRFLSQYFENLDFSGAVTVKEGDRLELGRHTLTFVMAPMVHWPEVMVSYDSYDKVLFSADGLGKFGALDAGGDWDCEARRYYFNIVGKYGPQVQALLKKAATLDIETVCPLHGPVLKGEALAHALELYDIWSSYRPESEGVFIPYASLHGNTAEAARRIAAMVEAEGQTAVVTDLARCDMSEALEDAFRYGRVILCASSYNAGLMPFMEDFLHHLAAKAYQNRKIALVENGTWAPSAAKTMREIIGGFKNIELVEPHVTIRGPVKASDIPALQNLVTEILK